MSPQEHGAAAYVEDVQLMVMEVLVLAHQTRKPYWWNILGDGPGSLFYMFRGDDSSIKHKEFMAVLSAANIRTYQSNSNTYMLNGKAFRNLLKQEPSFDPVGMERLQSQMHVLIGMRGESVSGKQQKDDRAKPPPPLQTKVLDAFWSSPVILQAMDYTQIQSMTLPKVILSIKTMEIEIALDEPAVVTPRSSEASSTVNDAGDYERELDVSINDTDARVVDATMARPYFKTSPVEYGGHSNLQVPNNAMLVNKRELATLRKYAAIGKRLTEALSKKKYSGNDESRRILGAAFAMTPKLSQGGAELLHLASLKSFLHTADIPVTVEQLINVTPSGGTWESMIQDTATDTVMSSTNLLLARDCDEGLFFAADKADDKTKKGCVKIWSWHDRSQNTPSFMDGTVQCLLLDSDGTGDTSEDVADGVEHSSKKLAIENRPADGFISDNGGGGTIEKGAKALKEKNMLKVHALVGSCCAHNNQLVMVVPMKKVFGEAKLGTENVTQMLYQSFWVQKEYGVRESRFLLTEIKKEHQDAMSPEELADDLDSRAGIDDVIQKQPLDARWWWTAVASHTLVLNYDIQIRFLEGLTNDRNLSHTYRNGVSELLGNMKNAVLKNDLVFIACIAKAFIFPHFKFFQGVDPNIGKPGFNSFHVLVRCFLMRDDLVQLLDYQNHPGMRRFMTSLQDVPEAEQQHQKDKATKFVEISIDEFDKVFQRWFDERLFFLGAFGEAASGQIVARLLTSKEPFPPNAPREYESEMHKRQINLEKFVDWIGGHCNMTLIRTSWHVTRNLDLIDRIGDGLDIWDRTHNEASRPFRLAALERYGGFPSITQHVERGVKNHNYCAANGRGEISVGCRIVTRCSFVDVANITTVDGPRDESKGRARLEKFCRQINDLEKSLEIAKSAGDEFERRRSIVKSRLTAKADSFEHKQREAKIQSFKDNRDNERVPLAAEVRVVEPYVTPLMKGKVQYGKCNNDCKQALRDELIERGYIQGVDFFTKDGVVKLRNLVKEDEKQRWLEQNPEMREEEFYENEERDKFFNSLIGADQFTINHVR